MPMQNQPSLRRLPAERARHAKRRLKRYSVEQQPPSDNVGGAGIDGDDVDPPQSEPFTLTGPLTITIHNVPESYVPPTNTPSVPLVTETPLQTTSTMSVYVTSSATYTSNPTGSTYLTATTENSNTASTASTQTASSTPAIPQRSSALATTGLSGSAIAGIVVVILLAVIATVVVIVRKRLTNVRQKKTASWGGFLAEGKSYNPSPADADPEKPSLGVASAQEPERAIAPPLKSYNNPAPAPASSASASLNGATVQCTFIPSLPDELSISTGERVWIVAEYDDGWALCANAKGEQGMVPIECLGKGDSSQNSDSKRSSSLSGTR